MVQLKFQALCKSYGLFVGTYSFFRMGKNKTINVFLIDYNVQLSKLTSQ